MIPITIQFELILDLSAEYRSIKIYPVSLKDACLRGCLDVVSTQNSVFGSH